MSSPHQRLRQIRVEAGYVTALAAAKALGVSTVTYTSHENGTKGISRNAERYARFFSASLEWLLTGRGQVRRPPAPHGGSAQLVEVSGLVGAGALVEPIERAPGANIPAFVELPPASDMTAFIVVGDSQYPRFLDGETILCSRIPMLPEHLVDSYAVVQKDSGERLIKLLRKGTVTGTWTLESFRVPAERNVKLLCAWRLIGVLARP